ncbi:MAG: hypothetical protein NXI18_18945 [Alphaproteobacteria bacterium]|nr:hypothetical protein [Alphaproteobacteria bacterium]
METVLAALAASDLAQALRISRWGYAAVNTSHVFGIALLVGGILPLDLRLLGAWPRVEASALISVLVPTAAVGLVLAVLSGVLLFAVRPVEYAANPAFLVKIVLLCIAAASAIATHLVWGRDLAQAPRTIQARAGAVSLVGWIGALVAGRMVAYVGD